MSIQAEIEDSTHLKLQKPLDAKVGSVITLEIVEPTKPDNVEAEATALLERAYSGDEPDYSEAGESIPAS